MKTYKSICDDESYNVQGYPVHMNMLDYNIIKPAFYYYDEVFNKFEYLLHISFKALTQKETRETDQGEEYLEELFYAVQFMFIRKHDAFK